jgi:hypothetical protein
VHEVDAEHITLLDFDVDPRRRQDVIRDKFEVVEVAHTDGGDDVAVGRQTDGASSSADVEDVGTGGVRRTRRDEHHRRRELVVRNEHRPDGRVDGADVVQLVAVAVALVEIRAGDQSPVAVVDDERLAVSVDGRLAEVGATRSDALALADRRWAHRVVRTRSSVEDMFDRQIGGQLEQTVSGSDIQLSSRDVTDKMLKSHSVISR